MTGNALMVFHINFKPIMWAFIVGDDIPLLEPCGDKVTPSVSAAMTNGI